MGRRITTIVGGVDTHSATHHGAVIDSYGRLLDDAEFPATLAGYATMLTWMRSKGRLSQVGVEGTGAYGAGLARVKAALRSLAIRAQHLEIETRALRNQLDQLTQEVAPATTAVFGLGPDTVSALLVTIGDNPDRLRSEAAFAHLCGVAPIPASSGKTNRHRLHRGGDRSGNSALHIAAVVRLRYDPRSRTYAERRTTEGLSMPEIIRCQKRYLAREVFQALRTDFTKLST